MRKLVRFGCNWENGTIANGVGATANFRADSIYSIACDLDLPVTLGHFEFECPGDRVTYRMGYDYWEGVPVRLETTSGTPSITVADDATAKFDLPVVGSQGLDKFGDGELTFYNENNYTGVTTIYDGTVDVWCSTGLGATGAGNETVVLSGGSLTLGPYDEGYNVLISEDFTISGPGAERDCGVLKFSGASRLTGSITLDGNATICQNECAEKGDGKITGNIALPDGADVTFVMEHYNSPEFTIDNFTTIVSGDISGTGGIIVTSCRDLPVRGP